MKFCLDFSTVYHKLDDNLNLTASAREALRNNDTNQYKNIVEDAMDENKHPDDHYFVAACESVSLL